MAPSIAGVSAWLPSSPVPPNRMGSCSRATGPRPPLPNRPPGAPRRWGGETALGCRHGPSTRPRPPAAVGQQQQAAAAPPSGPSPQPPATPPEELVQIRAYIRWEESGRPHLSRESQLAQYEEARRDLEREMRGGCTINQLRAKFGLPPAAAALGAGEPSPIVAGGASGSTPAAVPATAPSPSSPVRAPGEPTQPPPPVFTTVSARRMRHGADSVTSGGPQLLPSPPAPPPPPALGVLRFESGAVQRKPWELRALAPRPGKGGDPRSGGGGGGGVNGLGDPPGAVSLLSRWAREPLPDAPSQVSKRILPLARDGELLLETRTWLEDDPEARAGPRKRVARRQVVLTTDAAEPLVLHWGVSRLEPHEWLLPPEELRPAHSVVVPPASVETPFYGCSGCFRDGEKEDEVCYAMQRLVVDLPAGLDGDLMGLQFVLRRADRPAVWYKDAGNGFSNYSALFTSSLQAGRDGDELSERIVRAERDGRWWSLYHRYALCANLLDAAAERKDAPQALAKLLVWLRYSSARHLTWQRNYNVKPRELAGAQASLTAKLAQLYIQRSDLRATARLMLGTVGRGGNGGDGQRIRDDILTLMHRHSIVQEPRGNFLEQWHQKLHNNSTPDDVAICEAYLAFLKAGGESTAYWAALEAGGVTKSRLTSFERPIVAEPTMPPTAEQASRMIDDFGAYLAVLRKVHSGADLDDCIAAAGPRLPARAQALLASVRRRRTEPDPASALALIEAAVEARQELRGGPGAEPGPGGGLTSSRDTGRVKDLLYLDLALDAAVRLAVERLVASDVAEAQLGTHMGAVSLVLESLCLSSSAAAAEELVLCLLDWRRVLAVAPGTPGADGGDPDSRLWARRAKAVVDRLRFCLSSAADRTTQELQPTAAYMGEQLGVDRWAVRLFSEEVIRAGPGFALSLLIARLEPQLRRLADVGCWQIISPCPARGRVVVAASLAAVQGTAYDRPSVLVLDGEPGCEEVPRGVTAILTGAAVDVLSHAAVRARNGRLFFATCYSAAALDSLRALAGPTGPAVELTADAGLDTVRVRLLLDDDPPLWPSTQDQGGAAVAASVGGQPPDAVEDDGAAGRGVEDLVSLVDGCDDGPLCPRLEGIECDDAGGEGDDTERETNAAGASAASAPAPDDEGGDVDWSSADDRVLDEAEGGEAAAAAQHAAAQRAAGVGGPTGGETPASPPPPPAPRAPATRRAPPLLLGGGAGFGGAYALRMSDFVPDRVGAKSCNTRTLAEALRGASLPPWIGLPRSVAIPYGAFEAVLADPRNRRARAGLESAVAAIDPRAGGDALSAQLAGCRLAARAVLRVPELLDQLHGAMRAEGVAPRKADEEWASLAWTALTAVWASKWNLRAYRSLQAMGADHRALRMSVLVQPVIAAQYSFVVHTRHPATGDGDELYAEVVRGLGDTLVGNYPGRALSFTARKSNLDDVRVAGYPSKSVQRAIPPTFIFRSDSNGEDLDGYAGAGLYDSVTLHAAVESYVDYSSDPLCWDRDFQAQLLGRIARVGAAVEAALGGGGQDIEGVVRDNGDFYVVQTRPQV